MNKVTVTHDLDNIPDELREPVQWVVCNNVKVPIHARIGIPASTTNPGTWSSFEKAREAVLSGKFKHVGFVFTENDPYVGIDLDSVFEKGKILPWAQVIIDQMDSYTEVSQSGKGIHIIMRGKKPGKECKRKDGQVEIYEYSRYFALTGNLLDEVHDTINDRQEQLDTLYTETFDKIVAVSEDDYDVSDLVFDRNAKPPPDKLKKALRNEKFRETWEHERSDLPSFSEYDAALVSFASGYGWDDQEIVDLLIAFSREHGSEKDLIKRLRPDYVARTLALARGGGGLRRLQSEIKEIVLYGADEEGDFVIETKDGRSINMGDVSSFLSPRQAYQRLYIAGYVLSPQEIKKWPQTVRDWRPSIRIELTATKLGEFEQWMMNDVSRGGVKPPMVDSENLSRSLSEVTDSIYTGIGVRGYALNKEGRLYVHIPSIIGSAQNAMGRHLSGKRIAGYLKMMRFEGIENLSIYREKHTSRVTIWVSPAGFAPKELIVGREAEEASLRADEELRRREEKDGSPLLEKKPLVKRIGRQNDTKSI